MCRKLFLLISLALLLGSPAMAVFVHWTDSDIADSLWHNPDNWSLGRVPALGDDAIVKDANVAWPIFTTDNIEPIVFVAVGYTDGNHGMYMQSGSMWLGCGMGLGKTGEEWMTNRVEMSGGTMYATGIRTDGTGPICDGGYLHVPRTGTGIFTQTGGLADFGTIMVPMAEANGIYNLHGGVLDIREPSNPDKKATAVRTGFHIGENQLREFDPGGAPTNVRWNGKMNFGDPCTGISGTLIADGNILPIIDRYQINDVNGPERIFAFPNCLSTERGVFVSEYDVRNAGHTTVTAELYNKKQAYSPDPIDEHPDVATTQVLRWTAGDSVTQNDVYLSTSWSDVNDRSAPKVDVDTTNDPNYDPGGLSLGLTYFWAVDGMDASGLPGEIWSFTVTGKAKNPYPADEATIEIDADRNLVISWTPGSFSQKHDVYYGTDESAVAAASNPNSPPGQGRKDVNNFTPPKPDISMTYHWRIDEANQITATLVEGDMWEFTMADYLLEENFEGYADATALDVVWGLEAGTFCSTDLAETGAHEGDKAIEFIYLINSGNPDAIYREFTPAESWTTATSNIKSLSLWVKGDSGNTAPATLGLYAKLKDSSGNDSVKIQHPDADGVALSDDWIEWNIDLASFTDDLGQGGTFSRTIVKRISVGLTESGGGTPQGSIYVDDIRLYPSRCVPETGPAADITEDCSVDYDDLSVMGDDWLQADSNIPPDGVLNAFDFNSNSGWVTGTVGVDQKFGTYALEFDGVDDFVDIDDLALPNFYPATIALWVKRHGLPVANNATHIVGTEAQEYRVFIKILDDGTVQICLGDDLQDTADSDSPMADETWTHVALAITDAGGGDCYGKLYISGSGQTGNTAATPQHIDDKALLGMNIGSLKDGNKQFARMTVDDFRIYGSTLSAGDIALLADSSEATNPASTPLIMYDFEDGSGTTATDSGSIVKVYHTVNAFSSDADTWDQWNPSTANIYDSEAPATSATGSKFVNFKDYA